MGDPLDPALRAEWLYRRNRGADDPSQLELQRLLGSSADSGRRSVAVSREHTRSDSETHADPYSEADTGPDTKTHARSDPDAGPDSQTDSNSDS